MKIREYLPLVFVTFPVFIFDRLAKSFLGQRNFLFFRFVKNENPGAAFGILPGATWLFVFAAFVMIGLIFFFYTKVSQRAKLAFSLILAGTIGNLVDRLAYGNVIDVFAFTFTPLWHGFNLADVANTLGILLLLIVLVKKGKKKKEKSGKR